LAEWSKVNSLYTPKNRMQIYQYLGQSHDPERLSRLLNLIDQESGHLLLGAVEEAKIALTYHDFYTASLDFLAEGCTVETSKTAFEETITDEIEQIAASATSCVQEAGAQLNDIELIVLTGGSTEIPAVQRRFRKLFPNAEVSDSSKLDSVGVGLAYDSQRKFQKG
jgi:hypothetical chaperone protein